MNGEEAFRDSEQRLQAVLAGMTDAYYFYDQEWKFADVNQRAEEYFGHKKKDLIGRTVWDLFPHTVGNKIWSEYHQAMAEGKPSHFEAQSGINGRHYEFHAYPESSGLAVYIRDINDRKIAEEALHESEEKYRTLFSNAEYGFVVVEPLFEGGRVNDLRYIEMNSAFERETGLHAADFLGKRLLEVLPGIEPQWIDIFDQAAQSGMPVHREDYNCDTGHWYQVVVFPYANGLLGEQFINITERKRAEEALRESEAHALQLANELEKRNKFITDFFINISHEFKTPLSILVMGIDLLERKAGGYDGKTNISKNIAVMRQNSYRLNRLVANLLDITKLDAGFMEPKWERTDIVEQLASLVASTEVFATQRGLKLDFISNAQSMTMATDNFMIERIVLNLVSNAIKHTPTGGSIAVNCDVQSDCVVVSVRDNGEGIPDDKKVSSSIASGRYTARLPAPAMAAA